MRWDATGTWNRLVEIEPRLREFKRAGEAEVLRGANPEAVYVGLKPFVNFLVGEGRGNPSPLCQPPRYNSQGRFAQILCGPNRRGDLLEGLAALEDQTNNDVVLRVIHDALIDADRQRRGH